MNQIRVVCYGDSNTWGYNPEAAGARYDDDIRWTRLLQRQLGDHVQVVEEGLSGRTTVFEDYTLEGVNGLTPFHAILTSQSPIDLLVLMLGTNDCKQMFGANAASITRGMRRLVLKAQTMPVWRKVPAILLVAPVCMGEGIEQVSTSTMGEGSAEKSRQLPAMYRALAEETNCWFMDANESAETGADFVHFTPEGHRCFAEAIAQKIREILEL